jgi:hypothetical protein
MKLSSMTLFLFPKAVDRVERNVSIADVPSNVSELVGRTAATLIDLNRKVRTRVSRINDTWCDAHCN